MGRAPGVTQRTMRFMNHRIRLAMQYGSFAKLSGEVAFAEPTNWPFLRTWAVMKTPPL
jgi:hypothetical protein